jgi:1,4-alpha-glucan branching enzyme
MEDRMHVVTAGVSAGTPMGATLVPDGATFRTWAPNARDVYVVTSAPDTANWSRWTPDAGCRLAPMQDGTWAGFVPGLAEGHPYLFWVRGPAGGTEGFKRDPYARELASLPFFPDCPCLLRSGESYHWHDAGWRTPPFHDLIVYQLHVGVFWGASPNVRHYGKFLDVAGRIPYLRDLGVTAIQLLPIQEYDNDFGKGYNGLDYFSPEMAYQVEDAHELALHLEAVNAHLAEHGQPPLALADLQPGPNQLKCLVDLCHLNGIAVIFDVVYNHAGGGFGDRSLHFFDRQPGHDNNRSLYFTDKGWAGGLVFAYWQAPVRQFLADNATFLLREFHGDGLRYDEVSVIHSHGGDDFCRQLTTAVRRAKPEAIQVAEFWGSDRAHAVRPAPHGLGFDAASGDQLRDALRACLEEAAQGAQAHVRLDRLRDALRPPGGFPAPWSVVTCLEDHDKVYWDPWEQVARAPRIARLADPANPRSWYARSRARLATTLLLTAPGIPMLFMGQEILEDKPWHDDNKHWGEYLVWWDGLQTDRSMRDFRRFVRDLVGLRRAHPALRGDGVAIPQVHEGDRVITMHRWVEGEGRDIVIAASFAEETRRHPVALPWPGRWAEVFNSDAYDHFPNPMVAGNGGSVEAGWRGGDAYPFVADVVLPANAAIVLARDGG